jgi:hypothetical protein
MAIERKAAIELDEIREKTLDQVSAADFLTALGTSGHQGATFFRAWPEKKKYELWAEPEFNKGINIGSLLKGIAEKKKVELEKDPRPEVSKLPGAETVIDPRATLIDPVALAGEVVRQLREAGR